MSSVAVTPLEGFTFGCDPELFVFDPDGKPVSAHPYIPGTKDEPFKVDKGAVQLDGTAAEFNIDPCSTFDEFNENITTVITQMKKFLPKGYTLNAVPSVVYDEKTWAEIPDSCKELGCTPDWNAWTGKPNPPPHNPDNPRLRTGSGHIHYGWTNDAELGDLQHLTNCRDLVKQLDWYLGGWSLRPDPDNTRRSLYGKAGACRYKPYGVEYRVLSNFWVKSKSQRLAVWNRMNSAIWAMQNGFFPAMVSTKISQRLIQSINTSTIDPDLMKKYRFPLQIIE